MNDIEFINRSELNKLDIKNLCMSCEHFVSYEHVNKSIKNSNGDTEIVLVQLYKDKCLKIDKELIFSNLLKSDMCPIGRW